jgi:hypothetical protein
MYLLDMEAFLVFINSSLILLLKIESNIVSQGAILFNVVRLQRLQLLPHLLQQGPVSTEKVILRH